MPPGAGLTAACGCSRSRGFSLFGFCIDAAARQMPPSQAPRKLPIWLLVAAAAPYAVIPATAFTPGAICNNVNMSKPVNEYLIG